MQLDSKNKQKNIPGHLFAPVSLCLARLDDELFRRMICEKNREINIINDCGGCMRGMTDVFSGVVENKLKIFMHATGSKIRGKNKMRGVTAFKKIHSSGGVE